MIGIGVMLKELSGHGNAHEVLKNAIGKTIQSVRLGDDDALHFEFTDGSKLGVFDAGQSCCESRYMRTDDDLSYFVGAELLDLINKDAPNIKDDDYGEHEVQFLEVKTSKGSFTMASHNEHNGYYSGFAITVRAE